MSATTAQPPAKIGELGLNLAKKLGLSTIRRLSSLSGPAMNPVFRQAIGQLADESLAHAEHPGVQHDRAARHERAVGLDHAGSAHRDPVRRRAGRGGTVVDAGRPAGRSAPWFDRTPPI